MARANRRRTEGAHEVFVDTSAFFVLADARDREHARVAAWIREATVPLVTSEYVFAETVSLLTKRMGKRAAIQFGDGLRRSQNVSVLGVTEDYRERAWRLFAGRPDQRFDFVDATSAVMMEALGIRQVCGLDSDFRTMGFELVP
ncbi:MAG: PIN domain-containing protein [bacterium]